MTITMWTDPLGATHHSIPMRWQHAGHTVELSGDPRRARRAGWTEVVLPPPTLAELKVRAIEANRHECARRILDRWPDWAQRNCALGVYSTADTEACAAWIHACTSAEDAAADLIDTAADAAVNVEWPA